MKTTKSQKNKQVAKGKNGRLVVYTVLIGDKEPLGNPLAILPEKAATDLEIDYVCITDNRLLKSDVWRFEYIDSTHLPPEKLSRRAKAMPHEYFSAHDVSLYIDNTVAFKRLPTSADILLAGHAYLFRVFRHPTRNHPGEEAGAIATLGYESIPVLCEQLDFYAKQQPIETITPLSTCTVILRSHRHPSVIRQGVIWWEQILGFSKRDQMSFDYAVRQAGCDIDYFPGFKHDNDLILWMVDSNTPRVAASFDSKRYAWIHRQDSEAVLNPKAHFLKSGSVDGPFYARQKDLLNYISYMHRSSLGDQIAPRRQISMPLGAALAEKREQSGRMLVVWVNDVSGPTAVLQEEFVSAAPSLATLLPNYQTRTLEISSSGLAQIAPNGAIDLPFDIVVVFGHAPAQLSNVATMLRRLASPDEGLLIALSSEAGTIDAIKVAQDCIADQFKAVCDVSVTSSCHDSLGAPVANSLSIFQWRASAVDTKSEGGISSDVVGDFPDGSVIKLNLGCGNQLLSGYINVDVAVERSGIQPDVNCDVRDLGRFKNDCADEILSIHVIEHFWRWEVEDILREWVRVLKPGGKLILECPNLVSACEALLKNPETGSRPDQEGSRTMWCFYGDPSWKDPLMCHRWLYTPQSLAQIMHDAGLRILEQTPPVFKARHPRDMRIEGTKPKNSSAS
jgi:hypothetical protein